MFDNEVNIYGTAWNDETILLLNETRGINISTTGIESLTTYQACPTYTDGVYDSETVCSNEFAFDRARRATMCAGLFDHTFDDSVYFLESNINTSIGCFFGSLDNIELQCNGFDINIKTITL